MKHWTPEKRRLTQEIRDGVREMVRDTNAQIRRRGIEPAIFDPCFVAREYVCYKNRKRPVTIHALRSEAELFRIWQLRRIADQHLRRLG